MKIVLGKALSLLPLRTRLMMRFLQVIHVEKPNVNLEIRDVKTIATIFEN